MRIGVPRESRPGERRVAATPATVAKLITLGYAVAVESGAGHLASFSDDAYAAAGAEIIADPWDADIILKVNAPTETEVARLHSGQILASLLAPAINPDLVEALRERVR